MPKVGVVLSGCGVNDGAEIHESVITMLALDRAGAEYQCMAPDVEQMHVVNHLTGEVAEGESRNVLVESARIARGEIVDLAGVTSNDMDALIGLVDVLQAKGDHERAMGIVDDALARNRRSIRARLARLKISLRRVHQDQLSAEVDKIVELIPSSNGQTRRSS